MSAAETCANYWPFAPAPGRVGRIKRLLHVPAYTCIDPARACQAAVEMLFKLLGVNAKGGDTSHHTRATRNSKAHGKLHNKSNVTPPSNPAATSCAAGRASTCHPQGLERHHRASHASSVQMKAAQPSCSTMAHLGLKSWTSQSPVPGLGALRHSPFDQNSCQNAISAQK